MAASNRIYSCALALLLTLSVLVPSTLGVVQYTVTEIGNFDDCPDDCVEARSINNQGQVVGDYALSSPPYNYHAFLYSSGVVEDLGTLGGACSIAYDINDQGQVVGMANSLPYNNMNSFLYDGISMKGIGASTARGINNAGQIVVDGNERGHACIYTGGVMQDIGTLPDGYDSQANCINNNGQIVGHAFNSSWVMRAFLYADGTMRDIGALDAPYNVGASANAINDSGQIVGYSVSSDSSRRAFFYSDGIMHELIPLSGLSSVAKAINNQGQVVGFAGTAFIYNDGIMTDINTLISSTSGWTIIDADDINDNGLIVGEGYCPGVGIRPVLLTPVPELPSLTLLMAACIGGVLCRPRWRSGSVPRWFPRVGAPA
jgi:probable HAF family extracellular repeat protein